MASSFPAPPCWSPGPCTHSYPHSLLILHPLLPRLLVSHASIPTMGSTLPIPSHLLELPFDVPWTSQAYYIKSNPASFPPLLYWMALHTWSTQEKLPGVHMPKLRSLTFFLFLTPSVKSVTMSCLCCLLNTTLPCYPDHSP